MNNIKNKKRRGALILAEIVISLGILAVVTLGLILFTHTIINSIFHAEEITIGSNIGSSILEDYAQNPNFNSIKSASDLDYKTSKNDYKYDIEVSDVVPNKLKLLKVTLWLSKTPRKWGLGKNYIEMTRIIRNQE
ncbi:MAG: hypothetical protein ABIH00_08290 [Armatimonadota bacterium]